MKKDIDLSTSVVIVRHGNTESNRIGIIQGHGDSPLSEVGITQVKALAKRLANETYDIIYCSDLGRTKVTAEEILKFQNSEIIYDRRLREFDFGILTGKSRKKFTEKEISIYKQLYSGDDNYAIPEGESNRDFSKRVINSITDIATKHLGKKILVIAHGGVVFQFTRYVLGVQENTMANFVNTNAAINKFVHNGSQWKLKTFGEICYE